MRKPEYIKFVEEDSSRLKTRIVSVRTVRSEVVLGHIHWYPSWRQYVFAPEGGMIFNSECLNRIQGYVSEMNIAHREKLTRERVEQWR